MFASILLLSSLVFSAFFLAFFLFIDAWSMNIKTIALALAVAQCEAESALSAFIAHNQPVNIESSDLEYLGGDYDPTDCPDSSCLFDALAMLTDMLDAEEAESQPTTPTFVASRPWDDRDTALARDWDGYQRFRAMNAHYPRVIRPDAAYIASAEESASNLDFGPVDDWFPRWCGATT